MCEDRGFQTSIIERLFAPDFKVGSDEPIIGVCGVDNAIARSALEDVGFARVIEAGLGKGEQEYLAFQVHTFPSIDSAKARWGKATEDIPVNTGALKPAYEALSQEGFDVWHRNAGWQICWSLFCRDGNFNINGCRITTNGSWSSCLRAN